MFQIYVRILFFRFSYFDISKLQSIKINLFRDTTRMSICILLSLSRSFFRFCPFVSDFPANWKTKYTVCVTDKSKRIGKTLVKNVHSAVYVYTYIYFISFKCACTCCCGKRLFALHTNIKLCAQSDIYYRYWNISK